LNTWLATNGNLLATRAEIPGSASATTDSMGVTSLLLQNIDVDQFSLNFIASAGISINSYHFQ